jgi:Cof subfamily protein (haloacid dehalogenase superfamily)
MNPKTIFFDIDGTLLGTRDGKRFQIPPSTLEALDILKKNGHRVVVCSGRQEAFIRRFFPGVFDSFVALNGAHIVYEGNTVLDRPLPFERVKDLMRHFDAYGCTYVFIGKKNGWARRFPEKYLGKMDAVYGLPDFLITEWEPEDVDASMMDFVFESDADYEKCAEAFTDSMVLNRHPGALTNDLSFRDWDKAKGIAEFLAYSGIRKEDTVAFGDGYNDIAMMGAVGLPVAMGNAVEEVKKTAAYVTAAIFDDGIYKGLRHLGLI